MDKKYYEFDSELELSRHLKYWSNACGELHHHGEYDLNDVSELPEELQRAYNEIWKEGNGCHEYLVEYDKKYYIALVSEFDDTFADDSGVTMKKLYQIAKRNALKLYHQDLFKNTILVIGKETGINECHEIIFLVPAMESENVYDEIEETVYLNVWNMDEFQTELITEDYIFTCNQLEEDENASVRMFTSNGKLLCENYHAYGAYFEELANVYYRRKKAAYIGVNSLYAMQEMERSGEMEKYAN